MCGHARDRQAISWLRLPQDVDDLLQAGALPIQEHARPKELCGRPQRHWNDEH
jgi:hypothetical protein